MLNAGESNRNREKTYTRESPLMDSYVRRWLGMFPELIATEVLYQYCNDCKRIEFLISPPGHIVPKINIPHWIDIQEFSRNGFVFRSSHNPNLRWLSQEDFVILCSKFHAWHCAHTPGHVVHQTEHIWENKIRITDHENPLFLSHTLRAIPRVRHLDIDLLLYEPHRDIPVLMLEESMSLNKNDFMTRKIAQSCRCMQARVITESSQQDTVCTTLRLEDGKNYEYTTGGLAMVEKALLGKMQKIRAGNNFCEHSSAPKNPHSARNEGTLRSANRGAAALYGAGVVGKVLSRSN